MSYYAWAVASDYGSYEGWQRPCGIYSTEEKALAAIGRALTEGLYFAQNLKVVILKVDEPIEDPREVTVTVKAEIGEGR